MLESSISNQVVFARNSFTELCSFHGMEIAIGKLNASDLKEIEKKQLNTFANYPI